MDTFAFEHGNVLESALSNLFKLSVNIGQKLVLLVLSQSASCLALDFGDCVDRALHAIDLQGTRHILVELRLPDFTEQEEIGAKLFLMGVSPEE